jgi:DNA-binding NarL/FixJ family response regulator
MHDTYRPRILIADDHTLVAEAVKRMLTQEFNVVGVLTNGRDLVEAARTLKPDLVLTDIAMPKLNGLDAGQRIKEASPGTRIIYLTMNADPEVAAEAYARGASAVVAKTSVYSELVQTIRHVLNENQEAGPSKVAPEKEGREPIPLTNRQRDVLQLLAEGLLMKEVASVLNLTTRTVAFHKYRIMQILNLQSDADLVQFAIRKHILFVEGPVTVHSRSHRGHSQNLLRGEAQLREPGPARSLAS